MKLLENTETLPVKNSEPIRTMPDVCPIVDHDAMDFDDCNISEVIMFLQKLAKSPNASAINMAFTKHITNALMQVNIDNIIRMLAELHARWESERIKLLNKIV